MEQIKVEVAIVGGGPSGLMLAIELGCRGVPCLLLDRAKVAPTMPKANATSSRTMEHFRRRGFADRIRKLGLPEDHAQDIVYCTRLTGIELARFHGPSAAQARETNYAGDFGEGAWPSPELPHRAQQMYIEPVLREEAGRFPHVDLRFGWSAQSVCETPDGVLIEATNEDGNGALSIFARYVVGCDGARSLVRDSTGIQYEGRGSQEREFFGGMMASIYLRSSELADLVSRPKGWQYWFVNPDRRGLMVSINGRDEFGIGVQLGANETLAGLDIEKTLSTLVGRKFSYKLLSTGTWLAGYALVATHYRTRRCFLVGDAAHLFTPAAGMGYNTAVDDAVNLGWKIAAVVQGWASESLLETYEQERRPIAVRNLNYARAMADSIGALTPPTNIESLGSEGDLARDMYGEKCRAHVIREYNIPGLQLGLRYESNVIASQGECSAPPPDSATRYVPSGFPGVRAPHIPIGRASLFDQFGLNFTLLCSVTEAELAPWKEAAKGFGIPLDLVCNNDPAVKTIFEADLILIRPDHHIAWRGALTSEPGKVLLAATGRCDLQKNDLDAHSAPVVDH